jgi:hypothetical protein
MKVRRGFVSNSSSSSFLIYGIALDEFEEKIETAKKFLPTLSEEQTKYIPKEVLEDVNNMDEEDAYEVLSEALGMFGMSFESICGEQYYIGKSWDTVGDNETGLQFKESVEKKLKELFGDEIKCNTYQAAWRNGFL